MTTIRHKEIVPEPGKPFEKCKLGREQYGDVLKDIVGAYADGFVMAINNEWGMGKTTFLRMWQQSLKDAGFKTLYFNAWENDFDSSPLVALMAEMKSLIGEANKSSFNSLVSTAATLTKKVLPALVKSVVKLKGLDTIWEEVATATAEGAADVLKEEIDDFVKKQEGLKEFRSQLERFIEKTKSDNRPLVFIIDELDRCRPTYSVELLEQIKHFFSVPGIVFVLAMDKEQLAHAVRGFYGSEQIDATEYLRRFIDVEYSIPAPDLSNAIDYFYEYYQFSAFFKAANRRGAGVTDDGFHFKKFAESILRSNNANLRRVEKIFAHARMGLPFFNSNNWILSRLYFILVYIYKENQQFYRQIAGAFLSIQALIDKLREVFPEIITLDEENYYVALEAQLAVKYNTHLPYERRAILFTKESEHGAEMPFFKSRVDSSENNLRSLQAIKEAADDWYTRDVKLQSILSRISLLQKLSSDDN